VADGGRWAGWTNAVCAAAAGVLGTVEGAAVSLGATTTGQRHLVAASDPWTAKAARLDQTILDAPGHDAVALRAPIDVSDVSDECERWPGYAAAAAEIGLTSVSAYPLVLDGLSLGVFTVYRRRAHMPSASETVDTAILADLAVSAVLADHSRVERELISDGGLGKHDVAVAAGMLCVERDLSFDEAILRLRGYAYAVGRGVRDVASDVVRHAVWIV
jgi:hypothetical protein